MQKYDNSVMFMACSYVLYRTDDINVTELKTINLCWQHVFIVISYVSYYFIKQNSVSNLITF